MGRVPASFLGDRRTQPDLLAELLLLVGRATAMVYSCRKCKGEVTVSLAGSPADWRCPCGARIAKNQKPTFYLVPDAAAPVQRPSAPSAPPASRRHSPVTGLGESLARVAATLAAIGLVGTVVIGLAALALGVLAALLKACS